jgi:hypothetical protein
MLKKQTENIVKSGEQHHPALFVFERQSPEDEDTQRVAIVPVPMTDPDSKQRAFDLIHYAASHEQVEGVIFVVESWVKHIDGPDPATRYDPHKSLEHDPERKEAIVFNAQKGTMQLIAQYLIDRTDNTLCEPPLIIDPMGDSEGAKGRMVYHKPQEH